MALQTFLVMSGWSLAYVDEAPMPDQAVPSNSENSGESAVLKMIRPGTSESTWSGTGCGWKTMPTWPFLNAAVEAALDACERMPIESVGRPSFVSRLSSSFAPGLTVLPPIAVSFSPFSAVSISLSDIESLMLFRSHALSLTASMYEGSTCVTQTSSSLMSCVTAGITVVVLTAPYWILPVASCRLALAMVCTLTLRPSSLKYPSSSARKIGAFAGAATATDMVIVAPAPGESPPVEQPTAADSASTARDAAARPLMVLARGLSEAPLLRYISGPYLAIFPVFGSQFSGLNHQL